MGVATTYNPGAMSRFTALVILFVATLGWPAFSADPPAGTTLPESEIDPVTGLSRSSTVRPLRDAPPVPDPRRPVAMPRRPHIALILPTSSPALGKLADAVRQGFVAAAKVAAGEALPVHVTAIESETQALVDSCRHAIETGALLIVGGLTRDGAGVMAQSDCARAPVLALNEVRAEGNPRVFSISLSVEHEARQAAHLAIEQGLRQAIVIHSPSAISRRVREAFEREWTRAAGEVRRIAYSGNPEDAALIKERIANSRGDMIFFALDAAEALAVRPYVSAMLPVYATSLSVNPRGDPLVNLDLQGVRYLEMPWFIHPDHPAVMVYPAPQGLANVEQERLYALGIDAFRLANLLARSQVPKEPVDGVTGRITIEPGNHFARQLSAAEIDGGRVVPLRN